MDSYHSVGVGVGVGAAATTQDADVSLSPLPHPTHPPRWPLCVFHPIPRVGTLDQKARLCSLTHPPHGTRWNLCDKRSELCCHKGRTEGDSSLVVDNAPALKRTAQVRAEVTHKHGLCSGVSGSLMFTLDAPPPPPPPPKKDLLGPSCSRKEEESGHGGSHL